MIKLARVALFVSAFAAIGCLAAPANAEDITILTDRSQIIKLKRPPGTIVVGNPSITDVTIQGNQLFVHGRAFGKTNIIVLDDNGDMMKEYSVNVSNADDNAVTVFKAAAGGMLQSTYNCAIDCEVALHIGDDTGNFKTVLEQQKGKIGIAQGQKSGEATAPNAPEQTQ
jgi:Flp pilus assembly secretin CpaC